jgi:hypothetical protein
MMAWWELILTVAAGWLVVAIAAGVAFGRASALGSGAAPFVPDGRRAVGEAESAELPQTIVAA